MTIASEKILLSTLEQADILVACVDEQGWLHAATPAFRRAAAPANGEAFEGPIGSWIPQLDQMRWAALWTELGKGQTTELRAAWRAENGGSGRPVALRVQSVAVDGRPLAAVFVRDVSEEAVNEQVQMLHNEMLEAVAAGERLDKTMERLCRRVEELAPAVICSVLLVDSERRLRPLAGPSLPEDYSQSLDGLRIGPDTGSCGSAAYFGRPVGVTDIRTDPRWLPYNARPLSLGLQACWSSPIKSRDDRVVGTFAFYYREKRGPTAFEQRIVDACLQVSALAIENAETQAQVHYLAFHDTLTKLANRRLFQNQLAEALNHGDSFALLLVDLDDFKKVNDTLGHKVGDQLLCAVAERLVSVVRHDDMIARFGGDEFGVLQRGCREAGDAAALAERIIKMLRVPFSIDDHQIVIGASIGISLAPGDGSSSDDLLKHADLALYRAKRHGSNIFSFFKPELYQRILARVALEGDLRQAQSRRELDLFYQPVMKAATNTLAGFEALLRWQHPKRGLLSASAFVGVAEEIGLIVSLSDWILRKACQQAQEWPEDIKLAVNLSPVHFRSGKVVESVAEALWQSGLSPRRLELEITENVVLSEDAATQAALRQLRELGVRISLDDFGVGYSSLSYLRAFRFDRIKIDASFVRELPEKRDCAAIVRAISRLAAELGVATTAEGVETKEQLDWLREAGVTEVQGYYVSPAQPIGELGPFLTGGVIRG